MKSDAGRTGPPRARDGEEGGRRPSVPSPDEHPSVPAAPTVGTLIASVENAAEAGYEYEWLEPAFFDGNERRPTRAAGAGTTPFLVATEPVPRTDPTLPDAPSPLRRPSMEFAEPSSGERVLSPEEHRAAVTSNEGLSAPGGGSSETAGGGVAFARVPPQEVSGLPARGQMSMAARESAFGGRGWSRPADLNRLLQKHRLVEVAHGVHQFAEMSAADIIRRVREHNLEHDPEAEGSRAVSSLAYRDLRQIMADGINPPSFEIRHNCIAICLHPVTALIFHDRVVLQLNDEIDIDPLLLKLEDITRQYSSKMKETAVFYDQQRKYSQEQKQKARRAGGGAQHGGSPASNRPPSNHLAMMKESRSTMLFGSDDFFPDAAGAGATLQAPPYPGDPNRRAPKFISFPCEYALLEVLISHAFDFLTNALTSLEEQTEALCHRSTELKKTRADRLKELHRLKEPIDSFVDRVSGLDKAFHSLIASEDDLAHMELTALYHRPELYHEDEAADRDVNPNLEILLEFFEQELYQLERRGHKLARTVANTERYITITLNLTRNELHFWELAGTIISAGLTGGAALSGVFGMNLLNRLEEDPYAFFWVSAIILLMGLSGVFVVFYAYSIHRRQD